MSRHSISWKFHPVFICIVYSFAAAPTSIYAVSLDWLREFQDDQSPAVSADGQGNVFVAGAGTSLLKYDSSGNLIWSQLLSTGPFVTETFGMSIDRLGSIYVTGATSGSLAAQNAGNYDIFVAKYNTGGSLLWTKQLGSNQDEVGYSISADKLGNVYICGRTSGNLDGAHPTHVGSSDAFVGKYDPSGNLIWLKQFGTTTGDYAYSVSVDNSGNAYISGSTQSSLAGPYGGGTADGFLAKVDSSGNFQWTKQISTAGADVAQGVSADGMGSIYVSGFTEGALAGPQVGMGDAFVSKYDASGNLLWEHQLGTPYEDWSHGVSADTLGNVYITGHTSGTLGSGGLGGRDAFLSKYDASGDYLWTEQFGGNLTEEGLSVSADGLGSVYMSGLTFGNLTSQSSINGNAFVVRYSDPAVPEPASISIVAELLLSIYLLPTSIMVRLPNRRLSGRR